VTTPVVGTKYVHATAVELLGVTEQLLDAVTQEHDKVLLAAAVVVIVPQFLSAFGPSLKLASEREAAITFPLLSVAIAGAESMFGRIRLSVLMFMSGADAAVECA